MGTDYARRLADTVMRRYPKAEQYPYRDWCYPQGYLLIGFSRLWKATGEERYRDYIYEYCDSHVNREGEITGFKGSSMDDMMAGSILVWMYEQTGEEKYARACRRIYEAFQAIPEPGRAVSGMAGRVCPDRCGWTASLWDRCSIAGMGVLSARQPALTRPQNSWS